MTGSGSRGKSRKFFLSSHFQSGTLMLIYGKLNSIKNEKIWTWFGEITSGKSGKEVRVGRVSDAEAICFMGRDSDEK